MEETDIKHENPRILLEPFTAVNAPKKVQGVTGVFVRLGFQRRYLREGTFRVSQGKTKGHFWHHKFTSISGRVWATGFEKKWVITGWNTVAPRSGPLQCHQNIPDLVTSPNLFVFIRDVRSPLFDQTLVKLLLCVRLHSGYWKHSSKQNAQTQKLF